MVILIKKLIDLFNRALDLNPQSDTCENDREQLRQELEEALVENKALKNEKAEIEALETEINEVIDRATSVTPPDGGGSVPSGQTEGDSGDK